jgi:hypothetical protein
LLGPDGKPPVVNADDIEITPDKNWLYFGMPMGAIYGKYKSTICSTNRWMKRRLMRECSMTDRSYR